MFYAVRIHLCPKYSITVKKNSRNVRLKHLRLFQNNLIEALMFCTSPFSQLIELIDCKSVSYGYMDWLNFYDNANYARLEDKVLL